jgi:hypothetical protein
MRFRAWLRNLFTGEGGDSGPLPSRHERREAARRRHRVDDTPPWPPEERHVNPDQGREVADIGPGLYGAGASHRSLGRRRRDH